MTHLNARASAELEQMASITANDPLYQVAHDKRMSGIAPVHLDMIAKLYPQQEAFARALYPVISFNLHAPLPYLASLVVLRQQFMDGKYGTMKNVKAVRMMLSVLAETNGKLARYLTPTIALTRQSWLTINMAMKNRSAIEAVCRAYGVDLITMCCCSISLTKAGEADAVLNSELVRLQDHVRSAADRMAVPVHVVPGFAHIPQDNAEVTAHEIEAYAKLEALLDVLAEHQSVPDAAIILADFRRLQDMSR